MQVFTPYPQPFACADCLDPRRLNKQIIECKQVLAAILGESKAWKNHPVTKQYRAHTAYLEAYTKCLENYRAGNFDEAFYYDKKAMGHKPEFLTEEFCAQHKRRLFTKDNNFYACFYRYGESQENWYYVDGKLLKYINGKIVSI